MSIQDALYNLGQMIEQQSIGENQQRSLDRVLPDGTVQKFGKLGDFAKQIDQSAERSYYEQGYSRHQNMRDMPKVIEQLLQEPDASVVIKKRAFSSLAENYREDLMDDQERLLLRATKILFQNKCAQIAAYEKLTKIEKITSEYGYIDTALLPIISGAVDSLDTLGFSDAFGLSENASKFRAILNQLKKAQYLSEKQIYTQWVPNVTRPPIKQFGDGTGVIEFTNIASFTTNTSIRGGGSCNLTFTDPYELMVISNLDIEKAIADATLANSYLQVGVQTVESTLNINLSSLRQARSSRGASQIIFKFDPDTLLGQRVRAIFERNGLEIPFNYSGFTGLIGLDQGSGNIDPIALQGSELLGNDGLNSNEVSLFNDVVSSYYKLFQLRTSFKTEVKNNNSSTNYVRQKLRLFYSSKYIIQPMDSVHIYIGSKSIYDDKVLGGIKTSFNQFNFLSSANTTIANIKTYFNANNSLTLEKSIFVGPDFPNALWLMLRNQFVNNKNGTHVFAGVVDQPSGSFSNGAHRVNVTARDNLYYFENGIANFKPSLDVFNGPLYDPLTPFKIEFDSLTGIQKGDKLNLLSENEKILSSTPAFLKYKQGPKAGQQPTENNFSHDYDRAPNSLISRVYYDPDGFVYRWKEGIATYVLFGDNYNNPVSPNAPVPITERIFAGQDAMNIISLLVCGEPYNFTTFFKGAKDFDNIGSDSASFFQTLRIALQKRNFLYGNFVPFKRLVIDEESFKQVLNNQLSVLNYDSQLTDLLKRRAELADKIVFIDGRHEGPINVPQARDLAFEILKLDSEIADRQAKINEQLNDGKNNLKIAGDDVSFDYDTFLGSSSQQNENLYNPNLRRELRRKINYLTQRLYWKVKANEDTNLFIVDDTYDKDYDIQIFEKSVVNSFNIFQSEFSTPKEQIFHVANTLNLEVFADTQGHIQARIPQYNRVPSSVFFKMLRLKHTQGIEIYPKFLEDIFSNQLESLIKNIEIIEDQIRIDCALLGKIDDDSASSFVSGNKDIVTGDVLFKFLSSGKNATILNKELKDLKILADPDLQDASVKKTLDIFSQQNKVVNIFDAIKRSQESIQSFKIDSDTLELTIPKISTTTASNAPTYIEIIKNRIFQKTGQQTKIDEFKENLSNTEIFKTVQDITQKISSRQRLIKAALYAMKNVKEGIALSDNIDNTANKVLFPNLYGASNIPESFEHLIEDESFDDLGPGSGSRYIIKNSQIKDLTIRETAPPYTAITVTGSFGDLFIPQGSLPQDLNAFEGGGNALTTVAAVDYDLWRMYGVRPSQNIVAPFITDAQTQGSPYAVSYLNRMRGEIFKASATLAGNEFIQPGEVYYLEDRDLLFYSESVSHSFSFSGQFSTSVEFAYGHSPGQYIPTPLDIIGKVFYKNKDITNFINYRQDNVYNHDHLTTLVTSFDTTDVFNSFDLTSGEFGDKNVQSIQKMLFTAASVLSKSTADYKPQVEIRIYFNSKNTSYSVANENLKTVADGLAKFLTGNGSLGNYIPKDNTPWLNKSDVVVKEVDIASSDEFRFVSSKAFSEARNIATSLNRSSIGDFSNTVAKTDNIIYNFIIDCWLVIPNEI